MPGSRPRTTTEYASASQATVRPATENDQRLQKRHKSSDIHVPRDDAAIEERFKALTKVLHDMKKARADRADNSANNMVDKLVEFLMTLSREACNGMITQTEGTVSEGDFEDTRRRSKAFVPYPPRDKGYVLAPFLPGLFHSVLQSSAILITPQMKTSSSSVREESRCNSTCKTTHASST